MVTDWETHGAAKSAVAEDVGGPLSNPFTVAVVLYGVPELAVDAIAIADIIYQVGGALVAVPVALEGSDRNGGHGKTALHKINFTETLPIINDLKRTMSWWSEPPKRPWWKTEVLH